MDLPINPPIEPMLAKAAKAVPAGDYIHEPKWDGFRGMVFRDGDEVFIGSRSGKDLGRYFPELVAAIRTELPRRCVIDGEIVVAAEREGRRRLAWDALSQRIHPAQSRIDRLAEETPAMFIGFDLLALGEDAYLNRPFGERRAALRGAYPGTGSCAITRVTDDPVLANGWFSTFEGAGLDGVVSKRRDSHYLPGKREMIKVKHARSADAVVIGYRPHKSNPGIGSMLLGLYRDGELINIGGIGAFTAAKRVEYLELLEPMRTAATTTPGEPNRWATPEKTGEWVQVRPELVVEIGYDQMEGHRLRHAAKLVRFRPDREPASCTYDQLDVPDFYDLADVLEVPHG